MEINNIFEINEIDYNDPGEDAFSKMLDGVMDEIDFGEFGFGATHKEKRIKLLK